jgi:hypothetical protein
MVTISFSNGNSFNSGASNGNGAAMPAANEPVIILNDLALNQNTNGRYMPIHNPGMPGQSGNITPEEASKLAMLQADNEGLLNKLNSNNEQIQEILKPGNSLATGGNGSGGGSPISFSNGGGSGRFMPINIDGGPGDDNIIIILNDGSSGSGSGSGSSSGSGTSFNAGPRPRYMPYNPSGSGSGSSSGSSGSGQPIRIVFNNGSSSGSSGSGSSSGSSGTRPRYVPIRRPGSGSGSGVSKPTPRYVAYRPTPAPTPAPVPPPASHIVPIAFNKPVENVSFNNNETTVNQTINATITDNGQLILNLGSALDPSKVVPV